jgi:hypothetical protein
MQLPTLHQVTHFPVHLHHQPNGTFGHGPIIISHHGAIPLRDQSNYNYNDDFYPSSVFMSPPSSVLMASPPPLPPIRDHNNNILSLPPRPTLLLAKEVDKNAIVGATQFRVGQLLQWMAQQKTDPRWMDLASKRRLLEVKVHQVSGIGSVLGIRATKDANVHFQLPLLHLSHRILLRRHQRPIFSHSQGRLSTQDFKFEFNPSRCRQSSI